MPENVNPTERQMEFFYEDKFAQENSLEMLEGNNRYRNRKLNPSLGQVMDKMDFESFQDTVEQVKTYLETKKIKDNFGIDHNKRRKWRGEMSAKYGKPFTDFYQKDKYRGNFIIPIIGWLETCFSSVNFIQDNSLKTKLTELSSRLPDYSSYNTMTIEEKDALLDIVDKIVVEFLDIVTI